MEASAIGPYGVRTQLTSPPPLPPLDTRKAGTLPSSVHSAAPTLATSIEGPIAPFAIISLIA